MDLEALVRPSETGMQLIEVVTAYVLVALFAVGVFDLGLRIAELTLSGAITRTAAVIGLIDTVLLLFIIVEVYQTVVAYSREKSVVRIVIVTGVIAVTRKIIIFRPSEYDTAASVVLNAASYALLLAVLVVALFVVRRTAAEGEPAGEL